MFTQIIRLFCSIAILMGQQAMAETGTSHNLFVIERIDEDAFFVGRANLVTRDGTSDTFFGYIDGNYRVSLGAPWALEIGYRQALLELSSGTRREYRPMFALYWRDTLFGGRFSNRNRIELRYFEGSAEDRVRYRNESVWRGGKAIAGTRLKPYVEEEFFYDLTDSELNINWLGFGVSRKFAPNWRWKLGYRLQSQKFGDWEHRHVLVTGISYMGLD